MSMVSPDLVIVGGRVSTLAQRDDVPREVTALAVTGSRISALGTDEEIRALAGPATTEIDAGGRRIIPGLTDGHIHVLRAGRTWNDELRWEDVYDLDEALRLIAERAERSERGEWVRVIGGWHERQFAQGRGPTREELDRVAPHHPVYVQARYDYAQLNTLAMERIGLTAELAAEVEEAAKATPGGGFFERDEDGNLTGRGYKIPLMTWFYKQLPVPTFEEQVASTATLSGDLARLGLTATVDGGGVNTGPDAYDAIYEAWRRGLLKTRVRLFKHAAAAGTEHEDFAGYLRFEQPHDGDGLLRVAGLGEVFLWRCHDRFGVPGDVSIEAAEELRTILSQCAAQGWSVHLHVHTREFLDVVLDVWEAIHAEYPIDKLRWAIVHGEAIEPRDIARLKALGAAVSIQSLMRLSGETAVSIWGAERVAQAPPVRALLEAGVPLPLGSDAMRVASYNPFVSMQWFVTGRTIQGNPTLAPENLHTREEALRGYTTTSAWLTFEEDERGTLEPGMLADLAVLSDDYFAVPEDQIHTITSDLTMVGGRIVWDSHALG